MLLFFFAFVSGLATILAPCIWPLLPIVLSSAAAGTGRQRPLGITLGIVVSFSVFTLTLSSLVQIFHFDPNALRFVAVIVIALLGLVMLVPKLSAYLEFAVSRLSSRWGNRGQTTGSGFWAGFVTGASLGIVWAPCAGPILAAIATLAATGQVTGQVVLITVAYALGTGIPLFCFATAGQKLLAALKVISPYTPRIQQAFGLIMILSAAAIFTNYDKTIELALLERFPILTQSITQFETIAPVHDALSDLKKNTTLPTIPTSFSNPAIISTLFNANTPAPELAGITQWLNTEDSPTIASLKGKVVLVDFWTYTCINCIRTLPHVTAWYDKYKDSGFVVLGIHTPEFEFEKDTNNVKQAIQQYRIHYPVGQDNKYATWNAFNNEYWPAEYLIDASGIVRRTHFGEGEYDEMEQAIQSLLTEAGKAVTSTVSSMPDETPIGRQSPETYLGAARAEYYYPDSNLAVGTKTFTLFDAPPLSSFSLGGDWQILSSNAVAGKNAELTYHFQANKVYLVLRPGSNKTAALKVTLDGKPLDVTNAGSDVKNGIVTIDSDRLYNLIDLKGHSGNHILKLEFETQGTEVFAFTFG